MLCAHCPEIYPTVRALQTPVHVDVTTTTNTPRPLVRLLALVRRVEINSACLQWLVGGVGRQLVTKYVLFTPDTRRTYKKCRSIYICAWVRVRVRVALSTSPGLF
jgi:hypothetical protein